MSKIVDSEADVDVKVAVDFSAFKDLPQDDQIVFLVNLLTRTHVTVLRELERSVKMCNDEMHSTFHQASFEACAYILGAMDAASSLMGISSEFRQSSLENAFNHGRENFFSGYDSVDGGRLN